MIKELKTMLHHEIKGFMLKELFNHRKRKEGLISLQNDLIGDIDRFLTDWEETENSYLTLRIKTGGFESLTTKAIPSVYNRNLIQFLEDLEVPQAPSNSPNKTEFHNGAVIMKDIILKKLSSLRDEPKGD